METVGAARAGFLFARTRAAESGQRSVDQGREPVRSGQASIDAKRGNCKDFATE
jgi:hypothetical protein